MVFDHLSAVMTPRDLRRRRADPHLLDRLHEGRPGLRQVLRLPEPVRLRDADAGALAANLLGLFIGWEGVGLCSYLLIGFWYEKGWPAEAGQKAFVVNRIGDACFLIGMLHARRSFARSTSPRSRQPARRDPRDAREGCQTGPRGAAALRRRLRQVGPVPALHLAARRHGRPDAGLRTDPRGDDGHRGYLPDRAPESALRLLAVRADGHRLRRRADGASSAHRRRSCSATSRRCWPTRPSASSATCSSARRGRLGPRPSSTWSRTPSSRRLLFLGAGSP